jgi:hypothetical protein
MARRELRLLPVHRGEERIDVSGGERGDGGVVELVPRGGRREGVAVSCGRGCTIRTSFVSNVSSARTSSVKKIRTVRTSSVRTISTFKNEFTKKHQHSKNEFSQKYINSVERVQ